MAENWDSILVAITYILLCTSHVRARPEKNELAQAAYLLLSQVYVLYESLAVSESLLLWQHQFLYESKGQLAEAAFLLLLQIYLLYESQEDILYEPLLLQIYVLYESLAPSTAKTPTS
jgi:hypothetical protein